MRGLFDEYCFVFNHSQKKKLYSSIFLKDNIKQVNKNKRFQKRKEDFICQNCQTKVEGTGYTNHCPECLWSKHVDKNPGDRKEKCQGAMEPVAAEQASRGYKIHHKCIKCGFRQAVKSAEDDNFDKILDLSTNPIKD